MITAYALGYLAALWGAPSWCNPWHVWLAGPRLAWAEGHKDARFAAPSTPPNRPKLTLVGR